MTTKRIAKLSCTARGDCRCAYHTELRWKQDHPGELREGMPPAAKPRTLPIKPSEKPTL